MIYRIEGSGPLFPTSINHTVETATSAVAQFKAVEKLGAQAVAFSSNGIPLSLADLVRLAEAEHPKGS
jgi:hypothetical protein